MKKLALLLFAAAIAIIAIAAFSASDSEETSTEPQAIAEANAVVLNQVRNEAKVLDAALTEANVLYVAVQPDGTDRSGYATYICSLAAGHESSVQRVVVVAANSAKHPDAHNAYGIQLGEAWCN